MGAEAMASWIQRYQDVRSQTERLCEPLAPEDCVVQSMPGCSPAKWHLAHTTWFFETFVLAGLPTYSAFDPSYAFLFNSYYESVGPMHARPQRGLLSRPTLEDVRTYRRAVDEAMAEALTRGTLDEAQLGVLEVGLHHEQQHQELLLTDIKHAFFVHPFGVTYHASACANAEPVKPPPPSYTSHEGGVCYLGHAPAPTFHYDNEAPRHRVFVEPFKLGTHLVTNEMFATFVADGGYADARHWLAEGWDAVQAEHWQHPLYWRQQDNAWEQFTLGGFRRLAPQEPVCHVSYFEADACARWAGARLPTEAEWETIACTTLAHEGRMLNERQLTPRTSTDGDCQFFGDCWEWTSSSYGPYPGYTSAMGALGEYNGKFMCNQYVLRGGSCLTPVGHIRPTYRNFFHPSARWQMTGIRLATS